MTALFGRTCAPSMAALGVESWIASLGASLVPPSLRPANAAALTTPDISGHTLPASWERLGQLGFSWKMSPDSSRSGFRMGGPPTNSSRTNYGQWVMRLRRESLARRKWARRTFGSGFSFWPTPDAWATTRSNRSLSPNAAVRPALAMAARLWRTPEAASADGPDTQKSGNKRDNVLPTLKGQVKPFHRSWPTARTITGGPESAGRKKELGRVKSGGGDLQAAALSWGTPRSTDSKGSGPVGSRSHKHRLERRYLDAQVLSFRYSLLSKTTSNPGTGSSRHGPVFLNPLFTEYLMGVCIGWSGLGRLEISSFLWWLRWHSRLLRLVLGADR